MTGKNQDAEFRHPDTVAYLQSLTKEEAAKHPPIVRERGGAVTQYWREGGRVRCREVAADELFGPGASGTEALLAGAEAEFGRLLPKLKAELAGGGVPDLDAFETSIREELLGCGAKAYAALLEAFDAKLPAPCCGRCGRRKERHRRLAKRFHSRFGPLRVWRTYYICRPCGDGHFPLDRALGLEGKSATPGAESIYADAASSDSYEAAVRKLGNLAGVKVSKATLRRQCMRIGEEMQAFEREDVEPEAPSASCILLGIDGTGIPMAPSEVEGVAGKQADGTAKTREAKTIVSARPAGIRRPGSFGGTRAAAQSARASTARGRKAE